MRQKMLLLAAVGFGLLAFALTYYQINFERRKALGMTKEVTLIKVTRNMSSGEEIKESDMAKYHVKRFKSALRYTKEIRWNQKLKLIGRKLLYQVRKGAILEWDDIETSGASRRSGLSAAIPTNMRAISIAVDATTSVTGLIQPGDWVDIIGTFRFPEMKGDKAFDTLTLTLLQRVGVLATGTNTNNSPGMVNGRRVVQRGYNTITLALFPKEVEMIIFASQKGRLSFSLRNHETTEIEKDLQSVNFKYLQENIKKYTKDREDKLNKRRY